MWNDLPKTVFVTGTLDFFRWFLPWVVFSFSVAQVLVGLQKQCINNFVFPLGPVLLVLIIIIIIILIISNIFCKNVTQWGFASQVKAFKWKLSFIIYCKCMTSFLVLVSMYHLPYLPSPTILALTYHTCPHPPYLPSHTILVLIHKGSYTSGFSIFNILIYRTRFWVGEIIFWHCFLSPNFQCAYNTCIFLYALSRQLR